MKTSQILMVAVAALGFASDAVAQRNFRGGQNKGGAATTTAAASVAATTTAEAAATETSTAATGGSGNNAGGNNAGGNNDLLLLASNVQEASDSPGAANATAGQSASDTDPANFINFCTGKTLTNGAQVTGGSCNGIVMGDIPSNANMVSAIVVFPGPGDDLTPNTGFNVTVQIDNLNAGSFTDPLATYYAAPQQLSNGNIVGHCHVVIQDLGANLAPSTPPDPATFAFFKGIDDAGNGKGTLQAVVAAGLPAGNYRVCTMNSASNHQPVLMPVAQRGAQDDCQKFTVGQGTGSSNAAGGGAGTGAAASVSTSADVAATTTAAAVGGNGKGGNGNQAASVTTTAEAAATTTAGTAGAAGGNTGGNAGGNIGGGRGGGRGGNRFGRYGRGRFAARDYVA